MLTSIFLVLCITKSVFSQPVLSNADLEVWYQNASSLFWEPLDWSVNYHDYTHIAVEKDPNGYYGLCAKILNQYDAGDMQYHGCGITAEFLTSVYPLSISGVWKTGTPSGNDAAHVDVYVMDSNYDVLSSKSFSTPTGTTLSNWTTFAQPIPSASQTPFALQINLSISNIVSNPNYYAMFDYIRLTFPASVEEINTVVLNSELSPTINPGKFNLDMSVNGRYDFTFKVFDITGREVCPSQTIPMNFGRRNLEFNYTLPNGIYIMNISCSKGMISKKFIVEN